MKHVLIYPVKKGYLDPVVVSNVAKKAESAGFYAFLSWDHYMLPDAPDTFDAWSLLAYLSGITDTIKLGTVVTPLPFRPPAQLAKIVSTTDVLSNGRTIVGVGAGWHRPEFEAFSNWDTPGVRVDRTKEALSLMTRLWQGETVDFMGDHNTNKSALIMPSPIQRPFPPLWFGVRGKRMLQLASMYADAWIPTNIEPDEYSSVLTQLREMSSQVRPGAIVKGALQNFELFLNADSCLERIKSFEEAGCEFYGSVWSYPADEMVDRIDWYKESIMPYF